MLCRCDTHSCLVSVSGYLEPFHFSRFYVWLVFALIRFVYGTPLNVRRALALSAVLAPPASLLAARVFFFLLARALLATRCPSRHSAPLIDTKIRREGSGHNGIECPAGRQVARRVWRSQEGVDRPDQTNRKAPCNREHAGPPGDSEQSRRIGVTRITPNSQKGAGYPGDLGWVRRVPNIEDRVEQPCIIALFLPYLLPTSKKHACKYL